MIRIINYVYAAKKYRRFSSSTKGCRQSLFQNRRGFRKTGF